MDEKRSVTTIPLPGPQRHQCRHCGQHSILAVRVTGKIYDVPVGDQFGGAPGVNKRGKPERYAMARALLRNPEENPWSRRIKPLFTWRRPRDA